MKTTTQRLKKRQMQANRKNKGVQPKGDRCFMCNAPAVKGACSRNCCAPSFMNEMAYRFPNARRMFGN